MQINVRLQPASLDLLDEWIATLAPSKPSRPEAIRGIVNDFLQEFVGLAETAKMSGDRPEPRGPATEAIKRMDADITAHRGKAKRTEGAN